MLAVKKQVFIAVISGKIANIFMGRRNFFIYLYLPVSGTEPLFLSIDLPVKTNVLKKQPCNYSEIFCLTFLPAE
jgi:hypothetical protein